MNPLRRGTEGKEKAEVALIDRTYTVRKPDGELAEVNVFDMNLRVICDAYVQLADGVWIKARSLVIQ